MTKLTRDDVLRVAQLAHLELSDAEVETMTRQLDSILSYVDKLDELDTEGVEPMSLVVPPGMEEVDGEVVAERGRIGGISPALTATTPLREDIPTPCSIIEDVLAGAPDPDPPYFRVPKVIDR